MESIVIAFMGYITTLVVGFYSADKTASASKQSVDNTFEKQRQLDKERQDMKIKGVLRAIYEELNVLWELYYKEIGVHWEGFKEGEDIFYVRISVTQDYLTIYRSNADLIGLIENPYLQRKIVKTYSFLQGLVECYKLNSMLVDRCEIATANRDKALTDSLSLELVEYAPELKRRHDDFTKLIKSLFDMLEEQLPELRN